MKRVTLEKEGSGTHLYSEQTEGDSLRRRQFKGGDDQWNQKRQNIQ